ncbi:hypothetical protein FH039_00485 [Thermococcus indicus]|uniref:Uncharacterized protein n=1 Tax=Thermococcus indicus TaxID=2586643 RepID=A0A4Y5SIB2_9EURY|nr:hypothetical protein [Thermococcus indicus]QDA30395.1 hypothetical protein FH039_00485 [Thermococcus indicus]
MDWKKRLREDGFVEVDGFRIELSLDNTFMDLDYIPRVLFYDPPTGRWHVLRNPIPRGNSLEESWDSAVEVLCRILEGKETPVFGEEGVAERFLRALGRLEAQ